MITTILYVVLLLVTGLVMPLLGVLNGHKVRELLSRAPHLRTSVYRQTVIMLLSITTVLILVMYFNQTGADKIGAGFLMDPVSVLELLLISLVVLVLLNKLKLGENTSRYFRKYYDRVVYLMPENFQEYRWSVITSFVAGFTEEIIFRGFMFEQLNQWISILPAVALVNIVFGLCHWGTGFKNASLGFLLGTLFSICYLLTGSLWLSVLLHVITDLMAMTLGYKIMAQQQSSRDYL